MKTLFIIVMFIGALILASCNPVKSTAEADKAVVEFHALFDAEDYDKIFDTAHADFKAAQPKADTIHFLRSVREKLGKIKSTNRTGWQANSFNMKTNVVLTFETQFENGKGVETFTYRISDGRAILLGWYINSNDLAVTSTKEGQQDPQLVQAQLWPTKDDCNMAEDNIISRSIEVSPGNFQQMEFEISTKGNGSILAPGLNVGIYDGHDNGLVFENQLLKCEWKDIDADGFLDLAVSGKAIRTGEGIDDIPIMMEVSGLFRWNNKNRGLEVMQCSPEIYTWTSSQIEKEAQ